jgi:hypothetical protein
MSRHTNIHGEQMNRVEIAESTDAAADTLEAAWLDEMAAHEAEERDLEEERQRDSMLSPSEELR